MSAWLVYTVVPVVRKTANLITIVEFWGLMYPLSLVQQGRNLAHESRPLVHCSMPHFTRISLLCHVWGVQKNPNLTAFSTSAFFYGATLWSKDKVKHVYISMNLSLANDIKMVFIFNGLMVIPLAQSLLFKGTTRIIFRPTLYITSS